MHTNRIKVKANFVQPLGQKAFEAKFQYGVFNTFASQYLGGPRLTLRAKFTLSLGLSVEFTVL